MAGVTPLIMIVNPERISYQIDLNNILLAGGVGFVLGFVMDRIEKGDPNRMRRWLKK